jgi:hypothetical protein
MSEPEVVIELDGLPRPFQPGELLCGAFYLSQSASKDWEAAELSVLWHTEGKGDEDMAVHFFERFVPDSGAEGEWGGPQPFMVLLPESPLSYHGVILSIRWCVRVRLFQPRGRELLAERPFILGNVPSARVVGT